MSENNENQISTITVDSEMDIEDNHKRKEKKSSGMKNCVIATVIVILAIVAVGLLIGLIVVAVRKDDKESKGGNPITDESEAEKLVAKASQVGNGQKISVEWNLTEEVDKVTVDIYHQGELFSSKLIKEDNKKVGNKTEEVDGAYGMLSILVSAYFSDYVLTQNISLNLSTSTYNLALLCGSYAVSMFSVLYPKLSENGKIPTFVWLERSLHFHWDNLPEELQEFPFMSDDVKYKGDYDNGFISATDYIRELHSINSESVFHMFYQDYRVYGAINSTYGLGLPKDKFYLHFFSDGDATSSMIKTYYNDPNTAQANYDRMKDEWTKFKEEISNKGYYDFLRDDYSIKSLDIRYYCTVISNEEENVNYYITTSNPAPDNRPFIDNLKSDDKIYYISLSVELDKLDDAHKDKLRKLFSFSDEYFHAAGDKKIMIFIGTYNGDEHHMYDYMKLMKYIYTDEYVYYYKGHPISPTITIDGKLEKLEEAGMIDFDSTIPFEIIYFFRPDVYACGYSSSSFNSLSAERVFSVVDKRKSYAYDADGNYKTEVASYFILYKSFVTSLATDDATYGTYAEYTNNYLIEYINNPDVDFSVYDIDNLDNHKHYKKNAAGTIEEVQITETQ